MKINTTRFFKWTIFLFFLLFLFQDIAYCKEEEKKGNETVTSFSEAKERLVKQVYNEEHLRKTFYCDCRYSEKKVVDFKSCGFRPRKDQKRAKKIEWEHVVPAYILGKSFDEWNKGHESCVKESDKGKKKKKKKIQKFKGRKCAGKVSPLFRKMESDLYNLVPAIGEVNADRDHYPFAEFDEKVTMELKNKKVYGQCPIWIKDEKVMPRDEIKGVVARIYFYMDSVYPNRGIISNEEERALFKRWDEKFLVTKEECYRNVKIEKVQKNENLILKERCKKIKL